MRLSGLSAAVLSVFLLAGCTRGTAPEPTQNIVDFTAPGAGAEMVERLMETAGSTRVVNVELTRTEAHVSVVIGQDVATYAYRDQRISQIDSDVAYVGQAIFDPRSFDLGDLEDLFSQAAAISGSAQGQQLQVVDYNNGAIYMNVTTNPETVPVFFTPDGALIRPLDIQDLTDLTSQLTQVVGPSAVRVGVSSTGSVYADLPAGPNQVLRVVRATRFPVRTQLKSDSSQPEPFDSSMITPFMARDILLQASSYLDKPLSGGFELVIERRAGEATPTATVTMGLKTTHLTLSGVVLTS